MKILITVVGVAVLAAYLMRPVGDEGADYALPRQDADLLTVADLYLTPPEEPYADVILAGARGVLRSNPQCIKIELAALSQHSTADDPVFYVMCETPDGVANYHFSQAEVLVAAGGSLPSAENGAEARRACVDAFAAHGYAAADLDPAVTIRETGVISVSVDLPTNPPWPAVTAHCLVDRSGELHVVAPLPFD